MTFVEIFRNFWPDLDRVILKSLASHESAANAYIRDSSKWPEMAEVTQDDLLALE